MTQECNDDRAINKVLFFNSGNLKYGNLTKHYQIIAILCSLRDILVKKTRARGDPRTALERLWNRLSAADALVLQVPLDERTNQKRRMRRTGFPIQNSDRARISLDRYPVNMRLRNYNRQARPQIFRNRRTAKLQRKFSLRDAVTSTAVMAVNFFGQIDEQRPRDSFE